MSFGLSWFLISLLYKVQKNSFVWWPFIPGGVLIALALETIGIPYFFAIFAALSGLWPFILVAVGLALILVHLNNNKNISSISS